MRISSRSVVPVSICGDDVDAATDGMPRADATYAEDAEDGPRISETVTVVGDRARVFAAAAE